MLVLGSIGSDAIAHEGHEHGDAPAAVVTTGQPRVSAQSESYELLGVLKGDQLSIYLDRFGTIDPVTDAAITVTIGEGEPLNAVSAADGTYTVALPPLLSASEVELIFAITARSGDDLLTGALVMQDKSSSSSTATVLRPASSWRAWEARILAPARDPATLAGVTFGLGLLFGLLLRSGSILPALGTAAATVGVLALLIGSVSGNNDDVQAVRDAAAAPAGGAKAPVGEVDRPRRLTDGTVFVPKPTQRLLGVRTTLTEPEETQKAINLIGRVVADPNSSGLAQAIQAGRVISPEKGLPRLGQRVNKGDVLAILEPQLSAADRTTIAERSGEIEQQIATAETKLRRTRMLVERSAAPASQIADAEVELEGLRKRREIVRQNRIEPDVLRAPITGIIAGARAVAGQVVQPQDVLFQIVDPGSLWVEALVYGDVDPATISGATASSGGAAFKLNLLGFSPALQQQATLVQFTIADPPLTLSVGQPVTVIAKSGPPVRGQILPREAIVRGSNGEAIVWRHSDPERFEARPVSIEPFDAARVIVAAGVKEGERITVRGAELISQIR